MPTQRASILFCLGFLLAGLLCLVLGGAAFASILWPHVADHWRSAGWDKVQAEVLSTSLHTERRRKSTSQLVQARYAYLHGGQRHVGSRVGISQEADTFGEWHEQQHRRLSEAKRLGQPVEAWVNPANPGEALLDRNFRPLLFASKACLSLLFLVAGGWLCFSAGAILMERRRP